jgi:hypothetical protein
MALVKPQRVVWLNNYVGVGADEEDRQFILRSRKYHFNPDSLIFFGLLRDGKRERGYFRLRNLHEILRYVAGGTDVIAHAAAKGTASLGEQMHALCERKDFPLVVGSSPHEPKDAARKVSYRDRYYWIPSEGGGECSTRENKYAFVVLHLLSQMTLTEPKVLSPLLTLGR